MYGNFALMDSAACQKWTSVPHSVAASTRMRAAPRSSSGMGTRRISSGSPKPVTTAARASGTDSNGYGQTVEALRVAEQNGVFRRSGQLVRFAELLDLVLARARADFMRIIAREDKCTFAKLVDRVSKRWFLTLAADEDLALGDFAFDVATDVLAVEQAHEFAARIIGAVGAVRAVQAF